jgi:tetratricopeptide (TPR) repeat protein
LQIPKKAGEAFNRGTRLLSAKDWGGSIAAFQLAIKEFPGFYEAYYRMGVADAELKHPTEAESAFRKSIELSDGRYAPPHFGLALILSEENQQIVEAESLARTGLGLDPSDAGGYITLGWILYATGRLPEAEIMVRQAALCQPDLASAYRLLAQIHQRQSNQSAIVGDFGNYFNPAPTNPPQAIR